MTNPIIEEVRAARASIAAEHGYDRARILAWARAEQAAHQLKNPTKASVLAPEPPRVQAVTATQTSARKAVRALGHA